MKYHVKHYRQFSIKLWSTHIHTNYNRKIFHYIVNCNKMPISMFNFVEGRFTETVPEVRPPYHKLEPMARERFRDLLIDNCKQKLTILTKDEMSKLAEILDKILAAHN